MPPSSSDAHDPLRRARAWGAARWRQLRAGMADPYAPARGPETERRRRRGLQIAAGVLASLALVFVLFLLLFDWNMLRGPISRFASAQTGRQIAITGDLEVRPWSLKPAAAFNGVVVDDPEWAGEGKTAQVERLTVQMELLPLLRGHRILTRLEVRHPDVRLLRAADGRHTWDFSKDDKPSGEPLEMPLIRRFVIEEGELRFDDRQRDLTFSGTISAQEEAGGAQGFRLAGDGRLNGEPFRLRVGGGPLINIDPGDPYPFDGEVRAGATRITAKGALPEPFDLGRFHLDLTAEGPDLADLYRLTGLALPNTPPYELKGRLVREGRVYSLDDLGGRLGDSDIRGDLRVDTREERPFLAGVDAQISADVAVAQPAAEIVERIDAAFAHQPALQLVGRGVGQGQAGQAIEIGEVRALRRQVEVEAAEIEGLGQRPLRRDPGGSGADLAVEGIGIAGIDIDQRPAADPQAKRLAVQASVAGQTEALRPAGLLLGRDRAGEGQVALAVIEAEFAFLDDEPPDERHLQRLPGGLVVLGEVPGVAAVGGAQQAHIGMSHLQPRQDSVSAQKRQQLHLHGEAFDLRGLALSRPFRIVHDDAVEGGRGLERPGPDLEVPGDGDLPPRLRRSEARDRPPQHVPVEEQQEQDEDEREAGQDARSDLQPPAAAAFGLRPPRRRVGIGHAGAKLAPARRAPGACAAERVVGIGGGRGHGRELLGASSQTREPPGGVRQCETPCAATAARAVTRMMRRSNRKLRFVRYSASSRTFSSMGRSSRPLICAQPVTPGRRRCTPASVRSAIRSSWLKSAGRGPTRLICPTSTLHNCGSSSRLERRSQRPSGVIHRSGSVSRWVATSGVSVRMVRNFGMAKI